jgi:hypothetical protein
MKDFTGTPPFMSPEQARMQWERIDARTDVYGLGAVLYALLTGQPPHPGASPEESLEHARRGEVTTPREWNRSIPRALEAITLKALAADPARRYTTAAELRRALRDYRLRTPRRLAIALPTLLVLAALTWLFRGHRKPETGVPPPLRVEAFDVELHRRRPPASLGRIGPDVTEARFRDDDVTIHARLSTPAHCYLIALNPDGRDQLCYPDSPEIAPRPTSELHYPPDAGIGFGLTDSVGLQAFVLVASIRPLPAYAAWNEEGLPWGRAQGAGVYHYDGASLAVDDGRGNLRERADFPAQLAAACRALQSRPGVELIRVLAFPVRHGPSTTRP